MKRDNLTIVLDCKVSDDLGLTYIESESSYSSYLFCSPDLDWSFKIRAHNLFFATVEKIAVSMLDFTREYGMNDESSKNRISFFGVPDNEVFIALVEYIYDEHENYSSARKFATISSLRFMYG